MRTAALAVLGFIVVFAWTLVAATGSHGPALRSAHYCGTWRPGGQAARLHVAYAHDMPCARARLLAVAYDQTHVCRRGSDCKGRLDGLRCRSQGSAGVGGLGWIGCGQGERIRPPRAVFTVERPGCAAARPSARPTPDVPCP